MVVGHGTYPPNLMSAHAESGWRSRAGPICHWPSAIAIAIANCHLPSQPPIAELQIRQLGACWDLGAAWSQLSQPVGFFFGRGHVTGAHATITSMLHVASCTNVACGDTEPWGHHGAGVLGCCGQAA